MSRLSQLFSSITHPALVAYVTAGYPSLSATLEVVPLLEGLGVDVVELGIPFSDPLVDGVTIQHASHQALKGGASLASCLDVAHQLRDQVRIPLLLMSYYNPILSRGVQRFCQEAAGAGVDGLIIPDLPPGEDGEMRLAKKGYDLDLVCLVAPTSTDDRIRTAVKASEGFVYLVSVTGVTGARAALPSGLRDFVLKVRALTDKPLCVGFGVSTPEQAADIAQVADGVVVGSRIVQLMGTPGGWQRPVSEFVLSLRNELR